MSAASKFLHFGTSLFHFPKALSPAPSLVCAKSFSPSQSLRFIRCSSSAAVDTITPGSYEASLLHPWPEWVAFVDRLKSKGYFSESSVFDDAESVYKDMNLVKDACLSFARDRYDVFK